MANPPGLYASLSDQGYLPPDATPDQVAALQETLRQQGRISYQQANTPGFLPPAGDIAYQGFHPPANNALDQAAAAANRVGADSTGTLEQVNAARQAAAPEMSRFATSAGPGAGQIAPPPAPAGPPAPAAKVNPADLSFAPAPRAASGAVDSLANYLTTPRSTTIPAANIPKVAPETIAKIQAAGTEAGAAQKQLGEAQAAGEELTQNVENVRGKTLALQATETQQAAEKHDEKIQQITEQLEGLVRDHATSKIDPDRWWKRLDTGDKIRFSVANMLGAFANGFSGGRVQNSAMETINGHIQNDLMAQRQEIEQKKGRVEDMRGLLAETYKRFGNMDQAMAAAHALALQQVDSEQRQYAALSNSQVRLAESRQASAKLQEEQALQLANLYTYRPGGTTTSNPLVDYLTYSKKWAQGDQKVPLMSFAEYTQAVGGGGHAASLQGEETPDARYRKYVDKVAGEGGTPLSRVEWDKTTSGEQASGPGTSTPHPQSVAYNPLRNVQGTEAYGKENEQARYNAALTRAILTKYPKGIERNQAMVEQLQRAYSIQPGDTQDTIDRKVRAARADLGMSGGIGPDVGFTPRGGQ